MCSAGAAMGGQAIAGGMSAYSQYQQGKMNEQYYNYLGNQADKQADQVDKTTDEQLSIINMDAGRQENKVIENSNQTISSQKAAMAANGVYSDSGTFSDVVGDSVDKRALDEAAIKYNADQASYVTKRQAINQKLELRSQAITARMQGSNARTAGNIGALTTLVGTAANVGSSYANSKYAK
jgi:hypothetical protein